MSEEQPDPLKDLADLDGPPNDAPNPDVTIDWPESTTLADVMVVMAGIGYFARQAANHGAVGELERAVVLQNAIIAENPKMALMLEEAHGDAISIVGESGSIEDALENLGVLEEVDPDGVRGRLYGNDIDIE